MQPRARRAGALAALGSAVGLAVAVAFLGRLVAYDLAGSRRYERFVGRQPDPHRPLVERFQTLGKRAYVAFSPLQATGNSRRYAVLELSSGRVLREVEGEMPALISVR